MPSLRAIEERFWTLVTAPEGVGPGLAALGLERRDLEQMIRGDQRLSSVERLDIYASMYFFRIRDVMKEDYRAVAACLGEDGFHDLAVDYLAACPPSHPSIRNAVARLPEFLETHATGDERPWLAELAQLEWRRRDLFDGPDGASLELEQLREFTPAEFVALRLALVPSHALVRSAHAIDEVWDAAYEDREVTPPSPEPRTILVWRRGIEVLHRALDENELALWPLLEAGEPFGVACDRLCERYPVEEASRIAFDLLARWVRSGLVAAK